MIDSIKQDQKLNIKKNKTDDTFDKEHLLSSLKFQIGHWSGGQDGRDRVEHDAGKHDT